MKDLETILQQTKEASLAVARLSAEKKKKLLMAIAVELENKQKEIFTANEKDVEQTKIKGATSAFIDRLTLTKKGFAGIIDQLQIVANLSDPVGEVIEDRILPNKLHLVKKRFPIGVILMIYESRPNVTVDVAGLCLKSGNAVILKGGSESINTNKALMRCLREVLEKYNLPTASVTLLENVSHEDVNYLLKQKDYIDLVIPRGSYSLTTAVAENARIPILYHAAGGARMYVDKSADIKLALEVCMNSKTQRTGVCNALDAVLVHKDIAEKFLPEIAKSLLEKKFEMRIDQYTRKILRSAGWRTQDDELIKNATDEDFATEFLDSILAVKIVADEDEALDFIKKHTHHHTEVLIAENKNLIEKFINEVDSAGLMINCSSRLHDGGEFGMGAEMGTATGKLHARGPVGVRELTTYKWIAYGNGQVRR